MRRILLLCLLPLALGAPGSARGEIPRLVATVGPGFTIELADANGTHVTQLAAGEYEVLVHDLSASHDFTLDSKTTQQRLVETTVEFVGDMTFTVNLPAGSYGHACVPHATLMNGSFVVDEPAPPPPPRLRRRPPRHRPHHSDADADSDPDSCSAAGPVKTLTARVSSTGVSPSARSITAARCDLKVVDRSRTKNFHLVGPGVNRKTGKSYIGTVTWRLRLAAAGTASATTHVSQVGLVVRPRPG